MGQIEGRIHRLLVFRHTKCPVITSSRDFIESYHLTLKAQQGATKPATLRVLWRFKWASNPSQKKIIQIQFDFDAVRQFSKLEKSFCATKPMDWVAILLRADPGNALTNDAFKNAGNSLMKGLSSKTDGLPKRNWHSNGSASGFRVIGCCHTKRNIRFQRKSIKLPKPPTAGKFFIELTGWD